MDRLLGLRAYGILDTPPEPAFDELARLTATVLGTPIALVSLVDADRQWLKAHFGLDTPQTPRDLSLCAHVVERGEPLLVPDAALDQRFADHPLVTGEPWVRAYAGMPLTNPEGLTLGSLCVLDRQPRTFTAEQLETLRLLSRQVVVQLEARRTRLALAQEREASHRAAERTATLFSTMAEGVVVQAPDGSITDANVAAEHILGLSADQLRGRSSFDPRWRAVHEDGRAFPGNEHPAVLALRTGQAQHDVIMGVQKPNGALTWISINAMPVFKDGVVVEAVTTFHDITALRTATERASQQERLATVGTLAAGVGHEINNPLAYIIGNVDFTIEELRALGGASPSTELRELIEVQLEAREGAERIRKIVRGLRSLAREDVALEGVAPEVVIESSLSMASHELKHRATVKVELEDTPRVLADESRLTQVLVNLLVNAAQAFEAPDPTKNRIVVTTRLADDGRVVIAVKDNGPGIPIALQRRVFDPFFTTKPVGQGTGLGLSVSRNIVTTLGGELILESTEGAGATFVVMLPAATTPTPVPVSERVTRGPRARVMVVDDEQAVLNTIRRILAPEHDVICFADAREALVALEHGAQVDLVLCDLMMPFLTGQDFFAQAKQRRPELGLRFVFITGGVTNPAIRDFLEKVPNERFEKPFSTPALMSLAHRFALARRPG
ncbi:MAG: ATP-binding protein [Myxococcota bacterium]